MALCAESRRKLAGYPHAPRSNTILHRQYEQKLAQAMKQDQEARENGHKPRAVTSLHKQRDKSENTADLSEG